VARQTELFPRNFRIPDETESEEFLQELMRVTLFANVDLEHGPPADWVGHKNELLNWKSPATKGNEIEKHVFPRFLNDLGIYTVWEKEKGHSWYDLLIGEGHRAELKTRCPSRKQPVFNYTCVRDQPYSLVMLFGILKDDYKLWVEDKATIWSKMGPSDPQGASWSFKPKMDWPGIDSDGTLRVAISQLRKLDGVAAPAYGPNPIKARAFQLEVIEKRKRKEAREAAALKRFGGTGTDDIEMWE
jgi:hypothetical protein